LAGVKPAPNHPQNRRFWPQIRGFQAVGERQICKLAFGRRKAICGSKFPDWGGRLANNSTLSMLMLLLAPKATAIRCPPPPRPIQPASCSPHPKVDHNCSLLPLPLAPFWSKAAGRYPLPATPKPFSAPCSPPPLREKGVRVSKKRYPKKAWSAKRRL